MGPDSATTQPRVPLRSSPAPVNPVTSQPSGIGHGSHTGTAAALSRACSAPGDGVRVIRSGWTAPCRSHCHALCQALGSLSAPWQRGQTGSFIMCIDVDLRRAHVKHHDLHHLLRWAGQDTGQPAPRIPCVGAIIKDPGGRLLLIKRGHAPQAGRWSLPGGRVEPGESDQQAVIREIREETGLQVQCDQLVG